MRIEGAGGTSGGVGRFFIGLAMMIAGGYLFLNAIGGIGLFLSALKDKGAGKAVQ